MACRPRRRRSRYNNQTQPDWPADRAALGLSRPQIFRYIVIKPALRTVYPALTSQFIYLMLNTSVVSVISATDLAADGAEADGEDAGMGEEEERPPAQYEADGKDAVDDGQNLD